MKNYEEIKEEESEFTKDYSDKRLNKYIRLCRFIRTMYDERLFWIVSLIPLFVIPAIFHYLGLLPITPLIALVFIASHFLFWQLKGKKEVKIMIDDIMPEINMTIKALEEIREGRNG